MLIELSQALILYQDYHMLPPPVADEARAAHADMEAVGMAPLVYFQAHDAPARHPPARRHPSPRSSPVLARACPSGVERPVCVKGVTSACLTRVVTPRRRAVFCALRPTSQPRGTVLVLRASRSAEASPFECAPGARTFSNRRALLRSPWLQARACAWASQNVAGRFALASTADDGSTRVFDYRDVVSTSQPDTDTPKHVASKLSIPPPLPSPPPPLPSPRRTTCWDWVRPQRIQDLS